MTERVVFFVEQANINFPRLSQLKDAILTCKYASRRQMPNKVLASEEKKILNVCKY